MRGVLATIDRVRRFTAKEGKSLVHGVRDTMRSSGWWYRAYMDSMGIDGTAGHMRCGSYTFACSSELAVVLRIPVDGVLAYD
jgi:hypothetical protein